MIFVWAVFCYFFLFFAVSSRDWSYFGLFILYLSMFHVELKLLAVGGR